MVARDFYSGSRGDFRSDRDNGERLAQRRADGHDLLTVLWRRKLTIVVALLLCGLAAGLYLFFTPARYAAETAILIDPHLGRNIGTDPAQPGFVPDTSAMDSQVKLLTSQTVLTRAAKAADLAADPEFNGSRRSLWARLFGPPLPPDAKVDLVALADAITIRRPERTYVVEIQVLSSDPSKAAQIANAVAQAYIDDQVDSRIKAAENDGKFVHQRLVELQARITTADDAVEAYKTKNKIVTTDGLRSNEQQVADLTRELGLARARTSDAQARLEQLQRMAREGRIDTANEALKSPTIERLRTQEADTERQVASLAMTLGSRHPALREAQSQQAAIHRLILDELHRVTQAAANEHQAALKNEQQLAAEIDRLKGQSNVLSRNLVPLRQLERDADSLRASYERFRQLQDQLTQQEADSPPARIIAVARPPLTPSSPRRLAVLAVTLAAGVFLGIGAALLRESAADRKAGNRRVETIEVAAAEPGSRRRTRYWPDDDDG